MALTLPNPGQNPWAIQLNAALSQLDTQTIISGAVVNGRLILTRNNGTTVDAGAVAGGGLAAEEIRDLMGQVLVAGSGVTLAVNDAADTITVTSTATGSTGLTAEEVRDLMGQVLVAGSGVTLAVNDTADTITVSSTATGGLTAEDVRDTVGQLLSAGSGINLAVNDSEDSIVISTTGGGGTGNLSGVGVTEVRTVNSQAEYDAITTKNPTTLYIVPVTGTIPDPDPDPEPPAHVWMTSFGTAGALVNFDTGQPFVTALSPTAAGGVSPITADGQFILGNTATTEQTVTVRVKGDVTTATFPTIVLRATAADNANQYRVQRGASNTVQILRRTSGSSATVFTSANNVFPVGTGLDFEFKASVRNVGATCEFFVWLDGTPMQTAAVVDSNSTRPAGNLAGVRGAMTAGGNVYSWDDMWLDAFAQVPA